MSATRLARALLHPLIMARFYRRGGWVRLAHPVRLDVSSRALGLTCYEVPSLDRFVGQADCEESRRAAGELRDWPQVWAVVVDFGIAEVAFAASKPQISRSAAETAARRAMQEMGDGVPRAEDCGTVEDYLARGEPWAVLYAPLSPTAFGVLSQAERHSEADFGSAVLELQRDQAWGLTTTTALALRRLPHTVQLRIFAFAFTSRALVHQ